MSISSELSAKGEELIINISGRFDFSSLQAFRDSYEKINPKPSKFTIDLKNSDYLDSSALGMLLALRDYANNDNVKINIINCNQDIKKIFVITKLDEIFSVT